MSDTIKFNGKIVERKLIGSPRTSDSSIIVDGAERVDLGGTDTRIAMGPKPSVPDYRAEIARLSAQKPATTVEDPVIEDYATALPGRMKQILVPRNRFPDVVGAHATFPSLRPVLAYADDDGTSAGYQVEADPLRHRDFLFRNRSKGVNLRMVSDSTRFRHIIAMMLASQMTDPDDRFGSSDVVTFGGKVRLIFSQEVPEDISFSATINNGGGAFLFPAQRSYEMRRTPEIEHEGSAPISVGDYRIISRSKTEDGMQTARDGRVPGMLGRGAGQIAVAAQPGHLAIVTLIWTTTVRITYSMTTGPDGPVVKTQNYYPAYWRPLYTASGKTVYRPANPDEGNGTIPSYSYSYTTSVRAFCTR